jgi:hypothetical protein
MPEPLDDWKGRGTSCECGYTRHWPGGPCTNGTCRHARRLTWREISIGLGVVGALVGLCGWSLWSVMR